MMIEKRICNVKRHTKGFIIDGERITRGKAVKMARRGKIPHVTAKKGPSGWYISVLPSSYVDALSSLPVKIES